MTRPITTAPADTARAMHAAEMRGLDMQDEDECTDCEGSGITHQTERYCTCAAGRELARYADDAPERIWTVYWGTDGAVVNGAWADTVRHFGGGVEYTRTDLCATEAECQRRVDAAVQAERDACAWTSQSFLVGDPKNGIPLRSPMPSEIATAIRARGQK